ncbi:MAG: M1 family aminopeptidase [Thermoanaerobaculia bacterium]
MMRSIFAFEVRYHLRSWLLWGTGAVFALMVFGAVTSDGVQIGGAIGNVHRNAPYVILQMLNIMSILALFVVTAFVASGALRDFDRGSHELFFAKPIHKRDYLFGRFFGSLLVSMGLMVLTALGVVVGSWMPWLEPERLGPFQLGPYLFGLLVIVLPSLFFAASLFFALAVLSRNWLTTYLGVVVFFAAYSLAAVLMGDLDSRWVAALLDPFGGAALNLATRYWTVAEKNSALPPIGGWLLANRLLWSALGVVCLAVAYFGFKPTAVGRQGRRKRLAPGNDKRLAPVDGQAAMPALRVGERAKRRFGAAARLRQFWALARFETKAVVKGVPFLVILAVGLMNFLVSSTFREELFGTAVIPVTRLMLDQLYGTFAFLLVIIVTFYSGELVGRERAVKVAEVSGSLPIPDWMPFLAKLAALIAVVLSFLAAGGLASMAYQLATGYRHLELGLYAEGLALVSLPFLLMGLFALILQVITHNKFVGYLVVILVVVGDAMSGALGWEHHLYRIGTAPQTNYSDMNGYGHFLTGTLWFRFYWALFLVVMASVALLFWTGGTESEWRQRLRLAKQRFRGPLRWAFVASLAAFAVTGGFLFYNTNVLNPYVPRVLAEKRQAMYEARYRRYQDLEMPRVVAVETHVDLYPHEHRADLSGHYRLVNKTARPIDTLHISLAPAVKVRRLAFPGAELKERDAELGYSIYRLSPPLAPGASGDLDFDLAVEQKGFVNNDPDTSIVDNGTFFNNRQYLPILGYDESNQLVDRSKRRKNGLAPVVRMAKLEDTAARRNTYLTADSDWIDFKTTVSTSDDQIALAPGYLVKEWREGGRHFFRYEMDSPILHFYSYLSAKWAVRKDSWQGVAIEVYYHPDHAWNVDRMVDGVKKSLAYFTQNFGPYQHRQVRIVEFPRFATFAQSFPNTIPFSEGIGFIADLSKPDAIDYVFYVTAHEVAHQWWAHQVIGGNVQGCTMLSESLAQYSALMVMEKEYGREKMRRFLKYELDRYLAGRSGELVEELPLMRVENQPYVHYSKGSLVFYALREAIGEGALNQALARYLASVKFQQPPYTYTPELLAYLREATPPEKASLLADLFENITLYDNRVEEASWRRTPEGRYEVKLELAAKKLRVDGKGVETEVPLDDEVEVGVFGEKLEGGKKSETVLALEKERLTRGETSLTLLVDQEPTEVGIDPYNKLVDRNSQDNRKRPARAGS